MACIYSPHDGVQETMVTKDAVFYKSIITTVVQQPNEIKCNVQYKLSRNRIKNFENNDYFYDWGMIEEIHIPGKNLTTYLKWMRVKNEI